MTLNLYNYENMTYYITERYSKSQRPATMFMDVTWDISHVPSWRSFFGRTRNGWPLLPSTGGLHSLLSNRIEVKFLNPVCLHCIVHSPEDIQEFMMNFKPIVLNPLSLIAQFL